MPQLESPEDLKEYCLRQLGKPVINIEIDDTQIFDRIDDTVDKFIESHYNGVTEVYLLHTITAAEVLRGFLRPNENVVSILEVLDKDGDASGSSLEEFERLNFNLSQSEFFNNMIKAGVSEYYLTRQHLNLFSDIFSPSRSFQYNPIRGYLNISDALVEGNIVIIHGYESIDPECDTLVYNDHWVKEYATALIKRQWGNNVKKFDGVQLPGGVTMNGQTIYDEAVVEIEKLDTEFTLKYEEPVDFFMGPSFI